MATSNPANIGTEPAAIDLLGRALRSVRISVTDHCNLRCLYCMPEDHYSWLPRTDLLSFSEICRVVDVLGLLGVRSIRLTGGEPLLRSGVEELVRALAAKPWVDDLAMTTNGVLLERHLSDLLAAGISRITVSLDTLDAGRFATIANRPRLRSVVKSLEAMRDAGCHGTKIDMVVMRGGNDDEIPAMIEFGRRVNAEVRFIEYMDVGGATRWSPDAVVSSLEIIAAVARVFGTVTAVPRTDASPANRYRLDDGTTFGVIASTTEPFCRTCVRSRLTADGLWLLCLYTQQGLDLRTPLRSGCTDDELAALLRDRWATRLDRGAEMRAATKHRRAYLPVRTLHDDPHLEMHTRGG